MKPLMEPGSEFLFRNKFIAAMYLFLLMHDWLMIIFDRVHRENTGHILLIVT